MRCKLPSSNSPGYQTGYLLLVPGALLWEQHVQPLFALSFGNVAQPFAGASKTAEKGWVWEEEARALRERWRSQGFRHHNARPWTEVPLSPPLLRGLPQTSRVAEVVELGFLWASKKSGLSPVSARDRPFIATNVFVDVSQNPSRNPWCYGLHRLARTSQIYSYEYDRAISAFEAFRIYGWRSPCLEGLTTGEAWDLVGDSMALQTLAVSISGLGFGSGVYMPGLWEGPGVGVSQPRGVAQLTGPGQSSVMSSGCCTNLTLMRTIQPEILTLS